MKNEGTPTISKRFDMEAKLPPEMSELSPLIAFPLPVSIPTEAETFVNKRSKDDEDYFWCASA